LGLLVEDLKRWDLESSRGVDSFVAISETIRQRIQRVYERDAEIIYPCVDLDFYSPAQVERGDSYLLVSALVPQKRIDLAVEAFNRNRRRLLVVGSGPLYRRLSQMAGANVKLLGWLPDSRVRELYRTSRALIFPGHEDFGLVPVEAQACGCPVIAYGHGGLTETVINGETGIFFSSQTPESLNEAVRRFEDTSLDPAKAVSNAGRFSREQFQENWKSYFRRNGLDFLNASRGQPPVSSPG
jgi:glycosyltransferase involved in cell wall biosynthesis